MRQETKNIQTRLDDLAASDERTASTIMNLLSWCDALSRAIETQRQENHRSVDRTADIINGELVTLRTELTAIADKLRGDKEPAQSSQEDGEAARLERWDGAIDLGAQARSDGKKRKVPAGLADDLHAAFFAGWDRIDRDMKEAQNVTQFPAAASG